jgi:hypothetical protein
MGVKVDNETVAVVSKANEAEEGEVANKAADGTNLVANVLRP